MRLFLDSSIVIEFLRGNESVRDALKGAEALYTDALCAYEVLTGERYNSIKGRKSSYLQASLFFAQMETMHLKYSDAIKAADVAARLIVRGRKVDDVDIIIAIHALEKGATIFTTDVKHFKVLEDETGVCVKVL